MNTTQAQHIDIDKVAEALLPKHNPANICQNQCCSFSGDFEKRAKGSALVLYLLFFCGFFPGLIYFMAYYGYDRYCPQCHKKQD